MMGNPTAPGLMPDWMPVGVRNYLDHALSGLSLREIARREGLHASTVLRQVRRIESRRDDPLVDEALERLAPVAGPRTEDDPEMTAHLRTPGLTVDPATLAREGRRILRRLNEPGAVLAIASDMEKAAVLREFPDGHSASIATVDRVVAQAFALQEWITCLRPGRVAAYGLTSTGRAALRRLLAAAEPAAGLAEAPQPFAAQHREWGERVVDDDDEGPRRVRYNLAESPVVALGRRRDKDGVPYLTPEQVMAGERLREDFELAQMGPRVAQNWDRFLTGGVRSDCRVGAGPASGPQAARDRVAAALRELGPGLGDMVLRCCCYLDGLEAAERRLGWSARSGKVVLRIALERLRRHYAENYDAGGGLIG